MIKVEVCSLMQQKSKKAGDYYNYIKNWGLGHQLLNCRVTPDRNSIVFFDESAFNVFQETFKNPWRRIY